MRWLSCASGRAASSMSWSPLIIGDLARPVGAVTGIAEAGKDERVGVEPLIDGGRPDRNVGMQAAYALDPFRCGQETDQADLLSATLLEPIDRGDRGVARRHHWRDHDGEALVEIGRRLEEILHR